MNLRCYVSKAKKFRKWVTSEVLPTVRHYNYKQLRNNYDESMKKLGDQINHLKKQNKKMKDSMKTEPYPKGTVFYVLDYTDDYPDEVEGSQKVYRIGMAKDMKSRKSLYDTHMLYNKKSVIKEEFKNPAQFEICMESALYEYRFSNKKSFYICTKKVLMGKFDKCKKMLSRGQIGGGDSIFNDDIQKLKDIKLELNVRIKLIDEELAKYDNIDSSESSSDDN